jgi:hypothetical protein
VDFLHIHAKNPDQWACFRSLHGINIHIYEYLYRFMREAQQTPSSLWHSRALRGFPYSLNWAGTFPFPQHAGNKPQRNFRIAPFQLGDKLRHRQVYQGTEIHFKQRNGRNKK